MKDWARFSVIITVMHILQQLRWSGSQTVMSKDLLEIKQEYNKLDFRNHKWTHMDYFLFWASEQIDKCLLIHISQRI